LRWAQPPRATVVGLPLEDHPQIGSIQKKQPPAYRQPVQISSLGAKRRISGQRALALRGEPVKTGILQDLLRTRSLAAPGSRGRPRAKRIGKCILRKERNADLSIRLMPPNSALDLGAFGRGRARRFFGAAPCDRSLPITTTGPPPPPPPTVTTKPLGPPPHYNASIQTRHRGDTLETNARWPVELTPPLRAPPPPTCGWYSDYNSSRPLHRGIRQFEKTYTYVAQLSTAAQANAKRRAPSSQEPCRVRPSTSSACRVLFHASPRFCTPGLRLGLSPVAAFEQVQTENSKDIPRGRNINHHR